MKQILTLSVLLLFLNNPVFCQLTKDDLNNICTTVKEQVEISEKRMKEYISQEIDKVNIKMNEMDKRLNQIFTLVVALVAFIAVVVGVPQIIVALQRKDMHVTKR